MLLTELVLHNFGVYRGRHVVDLAPPSPEQPVILVGGLNGAGKTTFLDALQLTLYGHRAGTSNRGSLGYEDYLRYCINRGSQAEDGAAIELQFEVEREGATVRYRVRRQWASQGGRVKERLNVWRDGRDDPLLAEHWADHVEELIPLEIASLFFFDGEKIEALADPVRAQTVVRSAVHSLLGINTVDRLSTDLVALQRRQKHVERDEALEARISELEAAHEQVTALRGEANGRLGQSRVELGVAERGLQRAEDEFAAVGGALLARRKELETQRDGAASQLDGVHDDLRAEAAGALPLALVRDLLAQAQAQARLEREVREQQQLAALLDARDEQVLAGLPDGLDGGAIASLADALRVDRERRQAEAPEGFEAYLDLDADTERALSGVDPEIDRAQTRTQVLLARAEVLESELTELDRLLAAVPAEDAVKLQLQARARARERVLKLRGRCTAYEEEKARLTAARDSAKTQLEQALRKRVDLALQNEDVDRLVQHAERARGTLARYRSAMLARHISKLEIAVLESFSQLMRKQGLVKDLRIDLETFQLRFYNGDLQELQPSRLSAGERQLLAIALLWGLARVAGNRLPTIIDTPLGRLDGQHRQHLVQRYFPHASRQVLLLSTDEEIDAALQAALLPHIGHSYLISYDDATHSSSIRPGYFWEKVEHVA